MKKVLANLVLILIALGICGQKCFLSLQAKPVQKNHLIIIKVNKKYGLKNNNGKIIIRPIYDNIQKTSYDLFVIIKNNKLGLIDSNGKILVNPKYRTDYDSYKLKFSDGVAAVIKSGKDIWGSCTYIDKTGTEILEPSRFGYSTMQSGGHGICSDFSDGLVAATDNKDWGQYYGYLNKQGKLVIKLENTSDSTEELFPIGNFSEGLAAVQISNKWAYINKTGKLVIKPQFNDAREFSEDLAAVYINNKSGFIDKTGKFIIKLQFDAALNFHENLAPVELDDKWGYIDKTGKFVIKPQYDDASNFSEKLAAVLINNKWGFIDKSGEFIIKPKFWTTSNFSKGEAYVEEAGENKYNDKCYYINNKGMNLYNVPCVE